MNNQQDNAEADEKTEAAKDENLKEENTAKTGSDECAADKANGRKTGEDAAAKDAGAKDAADNEEAASGEPEESSKASSGEESLDEENPEGDNFQNDSKSVKKDPKDAQIEELQDKYRRQMAEFDNFRKRSEKEKAAMYEIGARDIIEKILPIVDNFERGLESISDEEKATPFADGIDKIYKQLTKALEDMGVKPIEALGKEFNPDMHNAVMHVDDEEAGDNIIVEEFQKGYTYRDSVVRHSMVKVAN